MCDRVPAGMIEVVAIGVECPHQLDSALDTAIVSPHHLGAIENVGDDQVELGIGFRWQTAIPDHVIDLALHPVSQRIVLGRRKDAPVDLAQ